MVETQKAAQTRIDLIVAEMAESDGIDEKLKTQDQMSWVSAMNSIWQQAEETVMKELIYS